MVDLYPWTCESHEFTGYGWDQYERHVQDEHDGVFIVVRRGPTEQPTTGG